MSMIRTTLLAPVLAASALIALAGTASAAQQCGAPVHSRFGETRAYFQNSLGACRPDGYCSVVLALADPTDQAVYAGQFRIARPTPGADHVVELVAVVPMNAGDGQPMSVAFGRRQIDLTGKAALQANNANLFEITDTAMVEAIVSGARRAATMRWTYQTETGPSTAWFALGGVTRALNWIDCMGRR
ncbi:MAG: hypothetical protein Q8S03_03560 [Brevundimonas sp.]|uniref:hypothetical protein n=1 Tax=Brevundimonas sp. TaxID=1871086 RepID=UPI002736FB44|nr:hypothetical protein [Brevundimonas sp.]MDP3403742.1 hypothetical protein [Brevundimonas sp.]